MHSDEITRLGVLDPLLGVQDLYAGAFRQADCHWSPGDLLVLYSDGITEVRDDDGEMLGNGGLQALIREHRRKFQWSVADATVWRRKGS